MIEKNVKTDFAFDVAKIASGTIVAQLIASVIYPILSRIYTPESFGTYSLFVSIITIAGAVVTLRYEMSIALPERNLDGFHQMVLSSFLSFFTSVLFLILLLFFRGFLLKFFDQKLIPLLIILIPLSIFLIGFNLSLNYWNTRTKNFLTLSINRITKEISKDAVQISELAFPVPNGYLLIFGEFFGWLFSTAILLRNTLINLPSVINEKIYISFNELKKGFIRYIKFPKYGVLTTLINNLASQMSIFFLTLYFSKSDAGQFAISNNLLRAPLTFIGNSIGQVFYQRASTIRKDRVQLENLVEQTFNKLLNLSIMPIIFLLIFGKEFIIIFLGNQWGTAGVFTQILAPWILFVFISVPISTLVSINEKQEIGLLFNILLLVTRFLTLYIGYLFKNIILGLILFSITGALLYGALSIWLCTSVGVKLKTLTNNIVKTIFKMIPYVVLLTILKLVNFSDLIKLILAVIISAINFYLFFRKEPIFISFSEAIINKIKKKNN